MKNKEKVLLYSFNKMEQWYPIVNSLFDVEHQQQKSIQRQKQHIKRKQCETDFISTAIVGERRTQ